VICEGHSIAVILRPSLSSAAAAADDDDDDDMIPVTVLCR